VVPAATIPHTYAGIDTLVHVQKAPLNEILQFLFAWQPSIHR
jgi:hypothetical protein